MEDQKLVEIAREIIRLCRSKWDPVQGDNSIHNIIVSRVEELLYNAVVNRDRSRKLSHFYSNERPRAIAIECSEEEDDVDVWLYYSYATVYVGILIEDNNLYIEVD